MHGLGRTLEELVNCGKASKKGSGHTSQEEQGMLDPDPAVQPNDAGQAFRGEISCVVFLARVSPQAFPAQGDLRSRRRLKEKV